jgi:putative two-component system response regulator
VARIARAFSADRRGGFLEEIPVADVLIAEDDPITRRFLVQALEFGGHRVTAAADGLEAIARIDGPGCFDVVVTDYAMPRAHGVDIIVHAQRVDPMLPCVIVTAYRDLDLAMEAVHAGAVAFLPKPFKADHLLTVVAGALQRRDLKADALRLKLLAPMLERFTMVLASTLESKDTATQWHANRLVHLSAAIAKYLDLPEDLSTAIRYGACLHDIGKVAVPEALLRKPGKLTSAEFAVMRLHPEVGAMILENIDTWQDVQRIVRHHHERFDGGGYPDSLRGAEIPVGARIVAVVDAFDVMRSGRPYAPARPHDEILAELHRERGAQFDPEMVDAFVSILSDPDFKIPDDGGGESLRLAGSGRYPRREAPVTPWMRAASL